MSPRWLFAALGALMLCRVLWLATFGREMRCKRSRQEAVTSAIGLARLLTATLLILLGFLAYPTGAFASVERAWPAALIVTGAFMGIHWLLDEAWAVTVRRANEVRPRSSDEASGPTAGLRAALPVLVGTPGTVLGLVQVFGSTNPSDAVRFGAVSLVGAIGVGLILWMFVVFEVPNDWRPFTFLSVLLNVTIVLLTLGLASIGLAVLWRV